MTVKIKYHYGREVGRDMSAKECTLTLVDWDFDFINNLIENLDDAGYTVMAVSITNDNEMAKMGEKDENTTQATDR